MYDVWNSTSSTTLCCSTPSNCGNPFYYNGTPLCFFGYELVHFGKKWEDLQDTVDNMPGWSYDKRARFSEQGEDSAVDY